MCTTESVNGKHITAKGNRERTTESVCCKQMSAHCEHIFDKSDNKHTTESLNRMHLSKKRGGYIESLSGKHIPVKGDGEHTSESVSHKRIYDIWEQPAEAYRRNREVQAHFG